MLRAPAKLNLSLRILGKRSDGFHELTTRMAPLDIHDEIDIQRLGEGDQIDFTCSDPTLPADESNLMIKAYRALQRAAGANGHWRMYLEKHIPSGAGLGGGSSDAAVVLETVNSLLPTPLSLAELAHVAGEVGSDVPFFLHHAVCDASGRGERVTPVGFSWWLQVLLIKPPFGIPTPWAYQRWSASKELKGVLYSPQSCPWGEMVNDLERPVFEKHLFLPALKMWLLEQPGVAAALMSGSGATMFAILKDGINPQPLLEAARTYCGDSSWIRLAHIAV